MNEMKTKDLVKSSLMQTSDGFTRNLFERLELKKQHEKALREQIVIICTLCIVLLGVIPNLPLDFFTINLKIKVPLLAMKVAGALFVFIVLNKFLVLKNAAK